MLHLLQTATICLAVLLVYFPPCFCFYFCCVALLAIMAQQGKMRKTPGSKVGWPDKPVRFFLDLLKNVEANAEVCVDDAHTLAHMHTLQTRTRTHTLCMYLLSHLSFVCCRARAWSQRTSLSATCRSTAPPRCVAARTVLTAASMVRLQLPPSPPPTNTALTRTDVCLQPPCLLLLLLPPAYMCNPCHIELIVSEKNEDVARPADLPRRKATRKELAKRRVASGGGVEAEA